MLHETTYLHLEEIYRKALSKGYHIVSCKDYFLHQEEYKNRKVLINRIDVDLSLRKVIPIIRIIDGLVISGTTVFIRLHARYNPFSFENFRIIRMIQSAGFEIGLHSEIKDCEKIWGVPVKKCLDRDAEIFRDMTGELTFGIASHGSNLTGVNNLDFWKNKDPQKFGILYEAYNPVFFNHFYCSVGLSGWKCYSAGNLIPNDNRCLCEHLDDNHQIIYFTLHPIKFYERHCYE